MKINRTLLFAIIVITYTSSYSQCAMCRAVVENNDQHQAEGLNDGIITLMIIPYILVAIIGYFLWKYYKKNK